VLWQMAVTVDWPVTADSRPATPAPGCLTDNNQRTVDIPPVPGGQSVLHRALLWLTVSMLQLPGGQIRVVQDPGGVGTISRSLGRAWGFATKAIKGTHDSTLTQPCSHHSASAVGACKNHKRSRIKTNCPPPLWVALLGQSLGTMVSFDILGGGNSFPKSRVVWVFAQSDPSYSIVGSS
jgi:hypothetical protein